jgi:hypothetical protein
MTLFGKAFKKRLSIYMNSSKRKFTKQELIEIGMKDHPLWFAYFDNCLRLGFDWAIESCDENEVVIYKLPTKINGSHVGSTITKVFKKNLIKYLHQMTEHEEFTIQMEDLYKFGMNRVGGTCSEIFILSLSMESNQFPFSVVGYDKYGYQLRRKTTVTETPTWTRPAGLRGTVNGYKI